MVTPTLTATIIQTLLVMTAITVSLSYINHFNTPMVMVVMDMGTDMAMVMDTQNLK